MTWQPAAIAYPDIELILTSRYRSALASRSASDVFVGNKVPNPRRDRMLVIRRDGGTQGEMRDRPRVTLLVWSNVDENKDVDDLARLVMSLAPTFADGAPIIAVPTNGRSGPYPVPDDSGQPLRQMSIEFHTRGVQL